MTSFEKELEKYLDDTPLGEGRIVEAEVVQLTNEYVFVDLGFKSLGAIERSEFKELGYKVQCGDSIKAKIKSLDNGFGNTLLSISEAAKENAWSKIEKALNSESKLISVAIRSVVRGGLVGSIGGINAFIPNSLSGKINKYDVVNSEIEAEIIKVDRDRESVILSCQLTSDKAKKAFDDAKSGQKVKVRVTALTSFGAFAEYEGISGLIHISDFSWGHTSSSDDVLEVGQELDVVILSKDEEKCRLCFGIKQVNPEGWDGLASKYQVGERFPATIRKINKYGMIVDLGDLEGFVHLSDVTWETKYPKITSFYIEGQEVDLVVKAVDESQRKVFFSRKHAEQKPWDMFVENNQIGEKVVVTATSINKHGIFIKTKEGVDGLIPFDHISWDNIDLEGVKDLHKEGDSIECVIKDIDGENCKLYLSIKAIS